MERKFVLFVFLCCCVTPSSARDVTIGLLNVLTFYGLIPANQDALQLAGCTIMAVNHLNSRDTSIVPEIANLPQDLNVSYLMVDNQYTPSVSVQRALELVTKGADGIVGPVSSASTGPASLMSGIYKIPLMAYTSRAPTLSDKSTYPYFGRVCMSDSTLIANVVLVCKQMGWQNIALLYQNDEWGKGVAEAINTAARQLDVRILTSQRFDRADPESITSAANAAAQYGGRIYIFAWFDPDSPNDDDLFFAAEDAGIIGPGYVWVKPGNLGGSPAATMAASSDPPRMRRLLSGVLEVSDDALYEERKVKLAAEIAEQGPEKLYDPAMGQRDSVIPVLTAFDPQFSCGYAYDATIATGLALAHASLTLDGKIDREDVLQRLRNTDFKGATGHVKTDPANGDRLPDGITMIISNYVPTMTEDDQTSLEMKKIGVMDSGEIVKIQNPYFAGGLESWDEVPGDGFQCAEGYALSEQSLRCEACPPGTEQRGATCELCSVGRHAHESGTVACPKCIEGYANETGQAECNVCPKNSYRPAGTLGVSITECVCTPGTYSREGPGSACSVCPAGAQCEGGTRMPYPKLGFWGEKRCKSFGGDLECERWYDFLECTHSDCMGGLDFACAAGRSARLCRSTADEWYNVGRLIFLECSNGGTGLAFLGIVGVVLAWTVIVIASVKHSSIDVLVQFMLVNAMISSFGLKWHSNLTGLNVFLKITNFDVDFVSPGCFGTWKTQHAFFLQLLLPFLVTALWVFFLFVYRLARSQSSGERFSLTAHAIKVFVALSITVYHTALYKSFATFNCTTYPDGQEYHSLHPEITCWESTHISMVVVGVIYIALGGILLPAYLCMNIRSQRKQGELQDPELFFTYGWLHFRYRMEWKNWWVVVCFRRFAVAFIAALVPWSMVQAMGLVMLIMASLTAQVMVKPHVSHRIDLLEFFSKIVTTLYILGGMLMYTTITPNAQGKICTEDAVGEDEEFCRAENKIKWALSIFSLLCMSSSLFFSSFLAFSIAFDDRNSFRASTLLCRWHKSGTTTRTKGMPDDHVNQGSLGYILNSVPVLRWLRQVQHEKQEADGVEDRKDSEDNRLSSQEFAELEQSVSDLANHFSSSKSVRADVLSKVSGVPGLMEWLLFEKEGRESLLHFVNGFADFRRREKLVQQNLRVSAGGSPAASISADGLLEQHFARSHRNSLVLSVIDMSSGGSAQSRKKAMFPVSDLVRKEHLATAAYYMMTCSDSHRRTFCKLLDSLLKSNSTYYSIHDFVRSNSSSYADTPLAALRCEAAKGVSLPETEDSISRHRKLSLDNYQPPLDGDPGLNFSPVVNRHHARKTVTPCPQDASNTASALAGTEDTDIGPGVNSHPIPEEEIYVQAEIVTPRVTPVHANSQKAGGVQSGGVRQLLGPPPPRAAGVMDGAGVQAVEMVTAARPIHGEAAAQDMYTVYPNMAVYPIMANPSPAFIVSPPNTPARIFRQDCAFQNPKWA